ncbi:MAG: hypothetical protein H7836_17255, partial [Magnetococcus sp. YQC-3]
KELEVDSETIIGCRLQELQIERREKLEQFYMELEFKHVRNKYKMCCDPRLKKCCDNCDTVISLMNTLRHEPFDWQSYNLQNMELAFLEFLRIRGF